MGATVSLDRGRYGTGMTTTTPTRNRRPRLVAAAIAALILVSAIAAVIGGGGDSFTRKDAVGDCLQRLDEDRPDLYPNAGDHYDSSRWSDGDVRGWDIAGDGWTCTATDGYATIRYH